MESESGYDVEAHSPGAKASSSSSTPPTNTGEEGEAPPPTSSSGVLVELEQYLVSDEHIGQSSKALKEFYQSQNESIQSMVHWKQHTSVASLMAAAMQGFSYRKSSMSEDEQDGLVRKAIMISFCMNIVLFLSKVVATILTPSLLMITTTLDSVLDLLSGAIIFLTQALMKRLNRNIYKYPVGANRLENVGIVVFAAVMGTATLQIIQQGILNLLYRSVPPPLNYITLGLLIFTVVTKLSLYFFCRYVYSVSESNAVDALYHDHFNDVFMNTLVITALIISEYVWWLDSVCAILLSLFIIRNWIGIAVENIGGLISAAAPSDLTRFVTFIAANHHSEVTQIDTVKVYQVGSQYWAEVDIVLPQKMEVGQAHEIGESLQILLESMDVIERAFVHIDHEFQHLPEHGKPST